MRKVETIGTVYTFAIGAPATVDEVIKLCMMRGLDGATVHEATGIWKSDRETSVVMRVAGISEQRAQLFAGGFAADFEQEAVYLEHHGVAYLVYPSA